jgi:pyruvate/oxaloacetate carboxyltransferase
MNQYSDLLSELSDFLYPRSPYYGDLKSEYLEFNTQLQDFSQRVNYICGLQSGGKLSPEDAYKQIQTLWKQLKIAKKKILTC